MFQPLLLALPLLARIAAGSDWASDNADDAACPSIPEIGDDSTVPTKHGARRGRAVHDDGDMDLMVPIDGIPHAYDKSAVAGEPHTDVYTFTFTGQDDHVNSSSMDSTFSGTSTFTGPGTMMPGGRNPGSLTTMTTAVRPPASLASPPTRRPKGSHRTMPASKSQPFQLTTLSSSSSSSRRPKSSRKADASRAGNSPFTQTGPRAQTATAGNQASPGNGMTTVNKPPRP
ncbi:hypothetical protein XA68_11503 [Ophiocordyceps unilateralis]|uniref:Uncharacterized protein n=1 Tax=Ophiocordyceps unilateralis TaxID=268505 RepID=A0A2A9PFR0_OPHUN|nr:hypothetical protein XA68_11503 [Ophiocordyceps unilateralis]